MKYFLIISFLFVLGCSSSTQETETTVQTPFDWLLGERIRTNGDSAVHMTEFWDKNDTSYFGFSTGVAKNYGTMNDTLFHEDLRLFQRDSSWIYEVSGVHQNPVEFTMISYTDSNFVCQNIYNDFPKQISYYFNSGNIYALATNGVDSVTFVFE
jgi:hypothetical protein